ncbi:cytochrome b5 domain-containing protein 1 [Drosophila grimshawi]|uniref:Cytochrome b5 domain-containing protein 1 n=1 Tax=Drosophila grimshawi TaxID=7222 RepID=B4JQE6_DROGR|nr:cytochrome b5 domain-containing protein 1 [Drosophila grimshawi]EDV99126.1 GH13206 [Drosophila grimshawi]
MAQPIRKMRYYLMDEICIHNKKEDCWIVIYRNVFDLTPMIKDRLDHWNCSMDYLVAHAGKDLTHLFHENGEPRTEISLSTGRPRVLFPPILEVAISEFAKTKHAMWSQDPFYHIGRVTRRPRRIRLINTLTAKVQHMNVCDEDSIYDIQEKYKQRFNHHAGSYEWRKFSNGAKCCGVLNLNGTLDENGLTDDEDCDVELPPPSIWLYYTDDLTIA